MWQHLTPTLTISLTTHHSPLNLHPNPSPNPSPSPSPDPNPSPDQAIDAFFDEGSPVQRVYWFGATDYGGGTVNNFLTDVRACADAS